jgi:hypothetical protein
MINTTYSSITNTKGRSAFKDELLVALTDARKANLYGVDYKELPVLEKRITNYNKMYKESKQKEMKKVLVCFKKIKKNKALTRKELNKIL